MLRLLLLYIFFTVRWTNRPESPCTSVLVSCNSSFLSFCLFRFFVVVIVVVPFFASFKLNYWNYSRLSDLIYLQNIKRRFRKSLDETEPYMESDGKCIQNWKIVWLNWIRKTQSTIQFQLKSSIVFAQQRTFSFFVFLNRMNDWKHWTWIDIVYFTDSYGSDCNDSIPFKMFIGIKCHHFLRNIDLYRLPYK